MMICVIDYGMGNLRSVAKAIESLGAKVKVSSLSSDLFKAKALVLPGVGAFQAGMVNLTKLKLILPLKENIEKGKLFLGLCLGMQLLFTESEEGGRMKGLDLIKGRVVRFCEKVKIPQIGWNQLVLEKEKSQKPHNLFKGIKDQSYFYFVHSYYCLPDDKKSILATTDYGVKFASAIAKDNIFGLQFHPEKSADIGLKILDNFLSLVKKC